MYWQACPWTNSAAMRAAQLATTYNEEPVTKVTYLKIEYGHLTSMSIGSIQRGSR